MKVRCNKERGNFTIGKEYEATRIYDGLLMVEDDRGIPQPIFLGGNYLCDMHFNKIDKGEWEAIA
jgi:hypothetical protein